VTDDDDDDLLYTKIIYRHEHARITRKFRAKIWASFILVKTTILSYWDFISSHSLFTYWKPGKF